MLARSELTAGSFMNWKLIWPGFTLLLRTGETERTERAWYFCYSLSLSINCVGWYSERLAFIELMICASDEDGFCFSHGFSDL